ncbi:helix-turn-helix domain-containing protein [Streptomyces smaragdinus]|uniref:helix-turn-helix domain-containing protein n=1 Tax=Streptomyces smaragdinus TaxID=2585196 RepID=UPI00188662AE|nr:helix-turn-helix transcriptional regulator [Streptomyces smaragdinus]
MHLREEAGYSQEGMARELDWSWKSVANYERGRQRISVERLEMVCELVGVTLEQYMLLHRYTYGSDPLWRPTSLEMLRSRNITDLDEYLAARQLELDADVGRASYIADGAWSVVGASETYRTEVAGSLGVTGPNDPGVSPIRFVLFEPLAREVMDDHDEVWLPGMLAYLAGVVRANPEDPVLRRTHQDVMDRADLRGEYLATGPDLEGIADPRVPRFISHPHENWGDTGIMMIVDPLHLLGAFGFRRVTALPAKF